MSQVHSVTHVRYTHPLARLVYLVRAQRGMIRVGVAGRNGPLRRVAQEAAQSAAREGTSSSTVKAIFAGTYRSCCSTWWLAIMGTGNEPCHRSKPSNLRIAKQDEATFSEVVRLIAVPREEGVSGGQYRADRSLLAGRRNHQP